MRGFDNPKAAKGVQDLRERVREMERATSVYTRLTDSNVDGCQKLAKRKAITTNAAPGRVCHRHSV